MITTNIHVTDGLTNDAMCTVTNVVIDQTTRKISVILVAFDQGTQLLITVYTKMLFQYIEHRQHFL